MSRIETLERKVRQLYEKRNPLRSDWSDWLYDNHVFLVSNKAKELALRFGASSELSEAAGMLHDIADSQISRFDPHHEALSLDIARDFLSESGFTSEEISVIVDDSIYLHGCKNEQLPATLEGKVMATADAVVHITSDFYDFAKESMLKEKDREFVNEWGSKKIYRDFHNKIFFETVRDEVRDEYEKVRELFI